MNKLRLILLLVILTPIIMLVVMTPMDGDKQYLFALFSLGALLLLNFSKSRKVSIVMVVFSIITSTRYLYYRATETLLFETQFEAILGIILFIAEVYSWTMLLLGYLQTSFPLERKIEPLPKDTSLWPTVDVYIPTYNEELDVVQDTVLAAQCLDYPRDKLNIYLLDDGNRQEFAVFAANSGVGYITRTDNTHAKAGNLNNALKLTKGDLICIFDCDHVSTRIFLQATVGAFVKDPKLGIIQTPHHFYSPDPFERNLYGGRDIPNEGELFYGPIQQGNDTWNASFFCGSCAVLRRTAIEEIGGIAVETVTEDAHTALKMQRLGWSTAYLPLRLSAGLATERLGVHVVQRNRWARGMVQIFRLDNPLFGKGLSIQQRLCYLSAMMYFLFPLPRVIYLVAPLAYLLFDLKIIHASAPVIFAYALPHFIISTMVTSRLNGQHRYSFWGDIYDIALSLHLVIPTLITIFSPHRGKFNVTDKGQLLDKTYFDFNIVRPHIIVALLLVVAVLWGGWRMVFHHQFDMNPNVLALNIGWAFYSLFFLSAAIATGRETKQVRNTIRLDVTIPAVVHYANGIASRSNTIDVSMGGCLLDIHQQPESPIEQVELELQSGAISIPVTKTIINAKGCALQFDEMSITQRRELVRIVLARADAWVTPPRAKDNALRSMVTISQCVYDVLRASIRERRSNKGLENKEIAANKDTAKQELTS
ncbi:UDP-forming cellulose synthase catalytic subunit [Vibrio hippocampi]|uniref:Cellulose synthase catalytic subunit [UDP-forming] n=1 Tax=Vibrio hippocampi TaxID=654686 RepID=A0ABN8DHD3_9VIBR|nr:UDP-forming cellulose synthase catalytic subunit [Vibrio hippocampi]CAH0526210.1 Cellulose synthase 1 [Vibrio hippocampi]